MNITKITENDLKAALELHKNSGVCIGSLRQFEANGKPGDKAQFCIMGLITGGVAKNRHVGFTRADIMIDAQSGKTTKAIELAAGLQGDVISTNDSFTNMGALKQWQGGVLRRLLKSVQKNGPIELEQ